MNYAARSIWPEKSSVWEYLGAAESIEDFALMYATDKTLAVGTEFVVIEKAGADSDIQFFKVSRAEPYALTPASPRVESETTPDDPQQQPAPKEQSISEVWYAMFHHFLFFGKATATAFLFFLALIFIAKWGFNAW
ncbi:hypothetical protein CCR95_18230 [Thiocystis minor]|uniref:hypothetical protein n=1 Tax=Thiocystis minor TaxID=61597 RepID=UPI001911C1E7|nr:hypothetical protein [Thiocystis minor]MBK5965960.1 hypothetical protein [Thiocystis minor]